MQPRVCSTPGCPTIHRGTGKCPRRLALADRDRRPQGNPYASAGHQAFREAASKVARHVPTPFVRVDLYEAQDGPVFGEITPIPAGGTSQFVPEWDERLGRLWDRAVA